MGLLGTSPVNKAGLKEMLAGTRRPEGWAASTPRHAAISMQTEPRLRQKQICDHKFITILQ